MKLTKNQRITALSDRIRVLEDEINILNRKHTMLLERFQNYIGQRIADQQKDPLRFACFTGEEMPAHSGTIYFGEYAGQPCLCWTSAEKWWIRNNSQSDHFLLETEHANRLKWYKKIF